MTTIAIRDGIMAVDSLVSGNGVSVGIIKKWREASDTCLGGYIAGCGCAGEAARAMESFSVNGEMPEQCGFAHLLPNGAIRIADRGIWFEYDAPFYALGSGGDIALGAMAAGATAEEAVRIAAEYDHATGGEIHVLTVNQ